MSADAPTVTANARTSIAPAALLRALRLPAGFLLLLTGVVVVRWVFPRLDAHERNRITARWARALLRCFGVRVRVVHESGATPLGAAPESRMLLANHVSWIDIFAILAVAPAAFVAKAEIAGWPLAGLIVEAHILRQIDHDPDSTRSQRAQLARQAISACLGLALEDTESETLRGQRDGSR